MTIKGTIFSLLGLVDLEKMMTVVALESAFEREVWSVVAELNPDVKLAREALQGVTHSYPKHCDLLRIIDDTKTLSYDRIMMSVQEGWVF